jgi:hypothetical protein
MNSGMQDFERETLTAVLNSKLVWVVHVVTNALLMIAFFYWTQIPEATGWQFALTVICGLAIAFIVLLLHCATFVYFGAGPERRFTASLRTAATRVPAFLIWTVIFGFVLWWIGQWWDYDQQAGGWVRHLLPLFLRRYISPRSLFAASHWVTWFVYFFVWPILCLPIGAQVALNNFRGFYSGTAFRPVREWRFWLAYLVCFLVGAYIPYTLAWIVPTKHSSLDAQTWSMALRLGFGYLLLVTAWIFLCAAVARITGGEEHGVAASSIELKPTPQLKKA